MSLRLSNISRIGLATLIVCAGLTFTATAQHVSPYFGGEISKAWMGEFSPCNCNPLQLAVTGGIRIGSRLRLGLSTGYMIGEFSSPLLGFEGGIGLLPLNKQRASRRRLELRGRYSGLLLKNDVTEWDEFVSRGGYTYSIDVVWRMFAAQPKGARKLYMLAGRTVLRERTTRSTADYPLSRVRATSTGWRVGIGLSL